MTLVALASYMTERGLNDGELAAMIGVTDEAVRLWRHGRRIISPRRAIQVSKVTGIPRHKLRPDLWDPPPPAAGPTAANDAATSVPKRTRSRDRTPDSTSSAAAA